MPTRGKRGGGKTTGQKSNKSPQRGRGRGGRRFGGSTRDQLDKLITLREFTWTTNANQEIVINAPTRSDVERISRQFPKGTVKYQVAESKPYQVNFDASSDEEEYDSDVTDESLEEEDDDILDMEEAYHEHEAQVIKSIETFFADMPEHEQAILEDYVQNLGLSDQDLVANIAAFTLYENQEIFDDIDQKTKLDLSTPVSKSRDKPSYKQRKMQKSPQSPINLKSSPKQKKTPQKSPKSNPSSPTAWIKGGLMNEEQENDEETLESDLKTRDDDSSSDDEEEVPFNGQYSDSSEDEQIVRKRGPDFKKKKAFTLRDMHTLNHHIRDFIQEPIMQSMPFSPMSKTQRFQLSKLASFYGIKTKNVGAGKRCYIELTKTMKTRLFSMEDATTFMEEIFEDVKIEDSLENKKASPAKKGKSNNNSRKSPNQKKDDKYGKYQKKTGKPSPNAKSGGLVAENAKPLDDNNLGSRLLKSMGWQGGGLGANGQGIVNPIEAVIKQDRKGLGARY